MNRCFDFDSAHLWRVFELERLNTAAKCAEAVLVSPFTHYKRSKNQTIHTI